MLQNGSRYGHLRQRFTSVYQGKHLISQQSAVLELEIAGPVKIVNYRKGKRLIGLQAGETIPDGRFLYRIEGDRWIGVHGLLEGDRVGFDVEYFRRVPREAEPSRPDAERSLDVDGTQDTDRPSPSDPPSTPQPATPYS